MSKRRADQPLQTKEKPKRFQATNIFVTYPQNDVDKQTIVDRLLEEYPNNIEWIVSCNEDHEPKDDDPHIGVHAHFICKFKKRTWVTHAKLDKIGGKHGDYQCMKGGFVKAAEYIIKHGDYVAWGFKDFEKELAAKQKKKNPKTALIYARLEQGDELEDIKDDPILGPFVMMNLQKLQYYHEHLLIWNSKVEKIYDFYDNISPEINGDTRDLMDFMYVNLHYPRKSKQKQLWLTGPTNVGKTQLKEQMRRRFKVFIAGGKDILKGYRNNHYDIIWIDEPRKGQWFCEDMNKLLEGSTFPIPNRFVDVFKTDNPFIVVTTNHWPREFYPNLSEVGHNTFEAFLGRIEHFPFTEIEPIRMYSDTY